MTPEPTEAQIKEACECVNAIEGCRVQAQCCPQDYGKYAGITAVARLIAQRDAERAEHEAFRQRVGAFAIKVRDASPVNGPKGLREAAETFIQPDPEPTPAEVQRDLIAEIADTIFYHVSDRARRDKLAALLSELALIKDTRHD